jgi:hypothetical protein
MSVSLTLVIFLGTWEKFALTDDLEQDMPLLVLRVGHHDSDAALPETQGPAQYWSRSQ